MRNKMAHKSLFTSHRQDWRTPKKIYEDLNEEFNFDFDPCPSNPDFNGLEIEWGKCNFVNPPYKTKVQDNFVKKAVEEFKKGKIVVMLLPARTDTIRFHDYILKYATDIRFIKRRLRFDDGNVDANFPSMIVVFNKIPTKSETKPTKSIWEKW